MNTIGYLILGYMVFGVLLGFWGAYQYERLKRYVDSKYPEEGRVIRSYEGERFPWSIGARILRALIKKQSPNDSELAHLAKKSRSIAIYFLIWFVLIILGFAVIIICHLFTGK